MERMNLGDAARGFHSYRWLHYGYLQQGEYEKAAEMIVDMQRHTASALTQSARRYLIEMQSAQLIESGTWGVSVPPMDIEPEKLNLSSFGAQAFFQSMQAFKDNDPVTIEQQITALDTKLAASELLVTDEGIAMCSAGPTRTAPNKHSLTSAEVRIQQMKALVALLASDEALAEEHLNKAATLESQLPYSSGPAHIAYPAHEQYGDWLLSKERYEEALDQFNTSLERAPQRTKALKGKIAAAKALGLSDQVKATEEILQGFWKQAEVVANL